MIFNKRKQKIERAFGDKASSYSRYAILQKQSAKQLCDFVSLSSPVTILEIGCGTGFLTENLQKKYPNARMTVTDISKDMVMACQQKFFGYRNLDFQVMDGENIESPEKYDLIISNLAVQWFEKPTHGLKKLCEKLNIDGQLYFTTIGEKSFWQWTDVLMQLNLPSGILPTPSYDGIFHEEEKIISYQNGLDFLRAFKKIGAHQSRENYRPLSQATLRKACEAFDSAHHGNITWHMLFGALNCHGHAIQPTDQDHQK